jgi:hypothetical protein
MPAAPAAEFSPFAELIAACDQLAHLHYLPGACTPRG